MEEIWKTIEGHPYYEVSSFGRIRSLTREIICNDGRAYMMAGRILKPSPSGSKRKYLKLCLGSGNHCLVHIAVCAAFHGRKPSDSHEASHLDGNTFNNFENNLAWETPKENQARRKMHGTYTRGSNHAPAKLAEADVVEMRKMFADGCKLREAAEAFDTTIYNAYMIKSRRSWKWLI